jgi:RNA polymerase sigma-70 factor (ECF subfamily)
MAVARIAQAALCGGLGVHTTSASLLERLHQPDDQDAWGRFVNLYTPLLYFWACRLGLQQSDASDLVQDVFTLLVEKLPEFAYDPQKSFRNWLRTVLRNKWHEWRRRKLPSAAGDVRLSGLASPDDTDLISDAEFQQHLTLRALQLMQSEFRPSTWKACWEQVVQGRPADAVAAELGMTVNAAYLAKGRVLRRLRQELDGSLE